MQMRQSNMKYNNMPSDIANNLEQLKEDFLSASSHELKTPLTSQKAFIQLLDQLVTQNNDQQYKRYIKKIADQNEKLSQLVNSLLDASKIKDGRLLTNPTTFNLNTLIKEIIFDLNQAYEHSIILKESIDFEITTDKAKIDQVITNLIHNAVKYSSSKSEIIVTLTRQKDSIIVSIKDSGIGIDQENLEHIFKPFYRIKGHKERTFPGLGMGLFISNEIIKHLGGRMWVESTKGNGSVFYFSLPQI